MSYFAAGAWWTADGRSFKTQAEADTAERSPSASQISDDAFAQAMGRGNQTGAQAPEGRAGAASTPMQVDQFNRQRDLGGATVRVQSGNPNAPLGGSPEQQAAARQASFEALSPKPDTNTFLDSLRQLGNNPVINPIGYAAGKAGGFIDDQLGVNVSGYIQDPVGQGLKDLGAPDLVQAAANPTGYVARTAVNPGTSFGLNPGAVAQNVSSAANNLRNDGRNTISAVRAIPAAAANLAGSVANAAGGTRGGGGAATGYTPAPLPQASMTPQSILGMNTDAVRPSSTQQDQIVQQMLAQSNVQSGYQDFNSPQYDASRGAAMGYTSQLAGLANNNVAVTGLNGANFDASRATMNQITGQLQGQANNNVADIQANSQQRDQSRNAVMDTANVLGNNANRDIGPILADQRERLSAGAGVDQTIAALRFGSTRDVADIQSDKTRYDASSATSNDIIQRLIAAAEAQEGPSAAESLMLNAQERAQRNAYGDAASLGGGWRSQLTGQRRAMGQAASQQADIAAQLGALRANEAATFRGQSIGALGTAGGLSGDMSSRDAALAQSDASLLAQIRQGNQTNYRESQGMAGQLGMGRLTDASGFATNEADRRAVIEQANQANRLNSLLGAGNLQTGAMQSDTGLAQSNASLLAQVRQGNQANALASLQAAGQNQGTTLNADLGFATNDAQIRTQRELANQSNALNALLGASNAANNTAQIDSSIGINNSNNRVAVDQNNRANSIAALQNAGVLSSATRGQDVQLSVANQQALSSRISSAAQLSGTQFATQMDAALRQTDQALRQQQFEFMKTQAPKEWERWLAAAGSTAGLLGIL